MKQPSIIAQLIETAKDAVDSLTSRIDNVSYGKLETKGHSLVETILFTMDGVPHKGYLRGRNTSLLLMGNANDRSVAVRVLLDGDAVKL